MRIWTRKSALIQPRTSPGKSEASESESRLLGDEGGRLVHVLGARREPRVRAPSLLRLRREAVLREDKT